MPTSVLAWELLQRLAWSSVQACVLIGAVALLLRFVPRLPAAVRSALWWLVGAQLVLGLLWSRPVALPLMAPSSPAAIDAPTAAPARTLAALPSATAPALRIQVLSSPDTTAEPAARASDWPYWPSLFVLAWLAGLVLQGPRLLRQWRIARAARIQARPLEDDLLRARFRHQSQALGLRRPPEFRLSETIGSPQVGGWLRPVVLLPARQALDSVEWDMAVAHELAHLARHDLWLGVVPALAQRLFFFHPAVRWAMREYALHREAACDARVMRDHHLAAQAYGRMLLRLGVSHPLHAGLAGASPTFDNLKRRLLMLQQSVNESTPRSRGWLLVVLVALAGVLPYRVTARDTPAPSPVPAASAATPVSTSVPAVAPAARPVPAARSRMVPPAPPVPPPPPAAPAGLMPQHVPPPPPPPPPMRAPAAPDAPPPPPPPEPMGVAGRNISIERHSDATSGIALFDGDSTIINGTDEDAAAAQRLHDHGAPLLWFRHADKAYVIRDRAMVARAKAIYAPLSDMASEQGRLAGEQGALAGQQAGLAARDSAFASQQADLARRQAELAATSTDANEGDVAAQVREDRQRALEQEQASLEQQQAATEKEMGLQQHDLERQQAQLEKRQQALEQRQQQISRQAEQQMQQLLQDAIRSGKAQPVGAA